MDSISTAIMAALASGAAGEQAAESNEAGLMEAYEALKAALIRKYGSGSDLIDAVKELERKPTSVGRKQVLTEEVTAAKAEQDRELLALVNAVLDQISVKLDSKYRPQQSPPHLKGPTPALHFVGRKVELAQLLASLQPGLVMAVCGPSGIGKRTLVAEAVWKLASGEAAPSAFPDGIIYHSFYDQPRVDVALEKIARTFQQDPTPTPYDAAQRALVDQQALLVLDGVDYADDLPGILAVRGGCGVVVTSREGPANIADQWLLEPLPLEEAVSLLQAWAESPVSDERALREMCELVGKLPLALQLAGHFLAVQPENVADYLAWLKETSLPDLRLEQRQADSVQLILEHSVAQVSETARLALAVVGLLAQTPFDQAVVVEMLSPASNDGVLAALRRMFGQESRAHSTSASSAIEELVNYGLLRQRQDKYEVGHPLIHAYAKQRLIAPKRVIRRLATYYMGLTWEQSGLGTEGLAVLDDNRAHFMRVLAECLEWEDWEAAHGLAVAIEDYLDVQGYVTERITANEIGLIAAWKLGRSTEAAWLGNLGDTYRTMGQADLAIEHFRKALATARQVGDWHSEGNWLGNLGLAYRDLGEIEQARQYLKESHAIFEEIQSPKAALVRDWLAELDESEGRS